MFNAMELAVISQFHSDAVAAGHRYACMVVTPSKRRAIAAYVTRNDALMAVCPTVDIWASLAVEGATAVHSPSDFPGVR